MRFDLSVAPEAHCLAVARTVDAAGLEPATFRFGTWGSIQLSYASVCTVRHAWASAPRSGSFRVSKPSGWAAIRLSEAMPGRFLADPEAPVRASSRPCDMQGVSGSPGI